MFSVVATNQFKKDYKRCIKRGLNTDLINDVLYLLESEGELPEKYKPHILKGNY